MTKKDLKTGMKVIYEFDSLQGIVLLGADDDDSVIYNLGDKAPAGTLFEDIRSDLSTTTAYGKIIEVFKPNKIGYIFSGLVEWKSIWKREPEIEEISADEAMRRLEQSSGKRIKITR